jgi:hypothetical protein
MRRDDDVTRRAASTWFAVAVGLLGVGQTAVPAAAAQARDRTVEWSLEVGAARTTPFVEDGNGVTVRAAIGPFIGAGLALRRSEPTAVTFGVRASTAALRVDASGGDWRAGRVHRYDVRVGVERAASRRSSLGAAVFAGVLTGPDDVIPFRRRGPLALWGGELAGRLPLLRDRRIDLSVGADVARIAAQRGENPPMKGGWAGQLRVGLRHAFR